MAGRPHGKSRVLSGVMLTTLVALMVGVSSAAGNVKPAEVEAYREAFDVSPEAAEERLEVQSRGAEADIVGELEQRLDGNFAGVWFDNASGEFVVPIVPGTSRAAVRGELADARLAGDYRTPVVDLSWEELEAAQKQIDLELRDLFEAGMVQTSLDPRANAVVVEVAGAPTSQDFAKLKHAVTKSNAEVELRKKDTVRFKAEPLNCKPNFLERYCGKPLRGGVGIEQNLGEIEPIRECTAAFRARGNKNGKRYVLTAGHCVDSPSSKVPPTMFWESADELQQPHEIGEVEQYIFPGNDWAKVNATGSYWDVSPWPSRIIYWGENKPTIIQENYPIEGEASSYLFETVCHSGSSTGTSCGTVTGLNQTVYYEEDGWLVGLNRVLNGCVYPGDSGGPVFANNMALGILSGGEVDLEHPCNGPEWYYPNITEATKALGVHIYPSIDTRMTSTTVEASALNGNPGWLTAKGSVKALDGTPVNNVYVNVNLKKWDGSKYVLQSTLHPTVTNGQYEVNNWQGVGPGKWIAKVVLPEQGVFAESVSNEETEGSFLVKDGYRIVNKNSGKCLDVSGASKESGVAMQQWECLDPTIQQNQVFTLVPTPTGYELVARHSGRCVDVANASQSNGGTLQQWTCNGFGQQRWTAPLVETVGETKYVKLVAQHSGKCIDVTNASQSNGTVIQQWDCNGSAQQKWSFKSVDSAPIPTETFLTVPEEERLNGQPGYASAHGYVKTGAYPIGGNYVNVNYEKEVSAGKFELITSNHPTLNNEGFYESKYEALGSGNWRIWTGFPGAGNLAASQSAKVNIHLGTGYRFVFRHSGKCLNLYGNSAANGTPMVQWDCFANPSPSDGEVFTLVPFENGTYFEILINSVSTPTSGRCVDVTNGETGNGVKLQSYLCYNGALANQLWRWVPIAGQPPWNAFIAKHSGRCMDVEGVSTANGARLQQWDCNWTGNQQWKFQGVG